MSGIVLRRGSRQQRLAIAVWVVVAAFVLLVAPLVSSPYRNLQWTLVAVFATVAFGLNLVMGFTGQISLGHSAFFAVGAYGAAIAVDRWEAPLLVAIAFATTIAFLVGLVFSVPALRLRGIYLALVTISLAAVTPALIKRFSGVTGGVGGLRVPAPQPPGWSGLAGDQWTYYLSVVVAALAALVCWNLTRGASGRAMVAVRDNELAASILGVSNAKVKTFSFAVSTGCAGAAGAVYAYAVGFVAPDAFTVILAISFLTASVVGGARTIVGGVAGALFVQLVPDYASEVNPSLGGLIYGGVLIAVMLLMPMGVAGGLKLLVGRFVRVRSVPPPGMLTAAGSRVRSTSSGGAGGPGMT